MGLGAAVLWPMIVGGATAVYTSERQASEQRSAQRQANQNAQRAANQAEQDRNRANQRTPNTSALLAAARDRGSTGAGSTFLTGPAGVDPDDLTLGRQSLLGS